MPLFDAPPRRPRRHSSLVLLLALMVPLSSPAAPPPVSLMPVPATVDWGEGRLAVDASWSIALTGCDEARLRNYLTQALERLGRRHHLSFGAPATTADDHTRLVIAVAHPAPALPRLGDDESYALTITAQRATLRAATTIGAQRGLETLLQLVQTDTRGAYLPAVAITDAPRFPWRGLMIDVARHWQPIEVILRNLDAMALVKLNVLHLHLTDDQGFRIESRTHPELPREGSDGHYFTREQIRTIIAYAADRGIRVVPEFDIPGHATSWLVSHPELGSAPGPYAIERRWGIFDPVLDPTNEATYALLAEFLGEMADLFPDPFLHIGGDENNGVHWSANAAIQDFIRTHRLGDNAGLHAYFNRRIAAMLQAHGKRLVGWDEILSPDLPASSVIHSWRGPEGLAAAATQGYAGILSNGYYIDLSYPAADHYLNDPLPADTTLTPAEQARVLGGEATMWAEWVTPANIDSRIWPRTAAIAERLWSPATVRDVPDMYRRLALIDQRLQEAGTRQGKWPDLARFAPDQAAALRTLAAVVEPVKRYRRGGLQPDHTQFTPLDELADWARPESRPARDFADQLDAWLLAPGPLDATAGAALTATLRAWEQAAAVAVTAPVETNPTSAARTTVAARLGRLARTGQIAIAGLTDGLPLSPAALTAGESALREGAAATPAAVEFPSLSALRRLVAAAIDPAARDALDRAAWRRHVEARFAPPSPATATTP